MAGRKHLWYLIGWHQLKLLQCLGGGPQKRSELLSYTTRNN